MRWVGVTSCNDKQFPVRSALIGLWLLLVAPHQMHIQNALHVYSLLVMAGLSLGLCCCGGSPSMCCPLVQWKKNKGKRVFNFHLYLYLYVCRTERGRIRQDERERGRDCAPGMLTRVCFDVCISYLSCCSITAVAWWVRCCPHQCNNTPKCCLCVCKPRRTARILLRRERHPRHHHCRHLSLFFCLCNCTVVAHFVFQHLVLFNILQVT